MISRHYVATWYHWNSLQNVTLTPPLGRLQKFWDFRFFEIWKICDFWNFSKSKYLNQFRLLWIPVSTRPRTAADLVCSQQRISEIITSEFSILTFTSYFLYWTRDKYTQIGCFVCNITFATLHHLHEQHRRTIRRTCHFPTPLGVSRGLSYAFPGGNGLLCICLTLPPVLAPWIGSSRGLTVSADTTRLQERTCSYLGNDLSLRVVLRGPTKMIVRMVQWTILQVRLNLFTHFSVV